MTKETTSVDDLMKPAPTLCSMFDQAVASAPDKVALRHLGAALTYRELGRAVAALARRLAVVLHRMWIDGTEFRWRKQTDAAAAV